MSFWKLICEKKEKIDFTMTDTESAKQIVAKISSVLKECVQMYILVKIGFTVSMDIEKSKLLQLPQNLKGQQS